MATLSSHTQLSSGMVTRAEACSFVERLAANLVRVRVGAGMTQERLAELANISTRSLQRIERGRVTLRASVLVAIADALEVSVEELVRET
jgi:XRE family transcriptional regulator, regulator of sulfur utilization